MLQQRTWVHFAQRGHSVQLAHHHSELSQFTPLVCLVLKQRNIRAATSAPAEDPVGDDPGKRYHAWNRLSMTSMPDAVKHYNGTKGKFNGMFASLLVFLGAADFILTSAPSHYATLFETLKAEWDSTALEFIQYFGPMNLRIAHNDIINILLSILSKFAHTKEFVHAEIIRKHGKFPATNT
jgi:hypothetical protein